MALRAEEVKDMVCRLAVTHFLMMDSSKFIFVQHDWMMPIEDLRQGLSELLALIGYKSIDDIQAGNEWRKTVGLAVVEMDNDV